jgi:FkbM family methyltransferase
MKQFEFEYPWTKNRLWWMPENEEMMQGQFPILDDQIEFVVPHCKDTRTVVQAGGAFGMYPIRLSHHFDNVITFEPFEMNRRAMIANIQRMEHFEGGPLPIHVREFALYDTNTMVRMTYPRPTDRARSNGAMQVADERGEIPTTMLDLFQFEDLGLIWLDIEGSELRALLGAEETIKEHRPVVVIEEREFQKNYSVTPRKWLEQRGYRFVGKTHADAVMVPE